MTQLALTLQADQRLLQAREVIFHLEKNNPGLTVQQAKQILHMAMDSLPVELWQSALKPRHMPDPQEPKVQHRDLQPLVSLGNGLLATDNVAHVQDNTKDQGFQNDQASHGTANLAGKPGEHGFHIRLLTWIHGHFKPSEDIETSSNEDFITGLFVGLSVGLIAGLLIAALLLKFSLASDPLLLEACRYVLNSD